MPVVSPIILGCLLAQRADELLFLLVVHFRPDRCDRGGCDQVHERRRNQSSTGAHLAPYRRLEPRTSSSLLPHRFASRLSCPSYRTSGTTATSRSLSPLKTPPPTHTPAPNHARKRKGAASAYAPRADAAGAMTVAAVRRSGRSAVRSGRSSSRTCLRCSARRRARPHSALRRTRRGTGTSRGGVWCCGTLALRTMRREAGLRTGGRRGRDDDDSPWTLYYISLSSGVDMSAYLTAQSGEMK